MTRERIKDFKEIVLPFFTNYFLKENYENLGKSDAEEFAKDFSEIIELADKALEQEWIPISEKLPEKNGNYLVTYESSDGTATLRYEEVDHYGPDWLHESKHKKVAAWMPLPKPYESQGSEG